MIKIQLDPNGKEKLHSAAKNRCNTAKQRRVGWGKKLSN